MQCSHQHAAGSVFTADINGHTFTHTNVFKNAQSHTHFTLQLHDFLTYVLISPSVNVHVMQTKGSKMWQDENVAVIEGSLLPLVHQPSL